MGGVIHYMWSLTVDWVTHRTNILPDMGMTLTWERCETYQRASCPMHENLVTPSMQHDHGIHAVNAIIFKSPVTLLFYICYTTLVLVAILWTSFLNIKEWKNSTCWLTLLACKIMVFSPFKSKSHIYCHSSKCNKWWCTF